MHEVVPRAVRAAVRIDTMTCMMVFQVSFFMVSDVLRVNNLEGAEGSQPPPLA